MIEVNSNPSIRLLEQSGRADLILKIWHHTFSAMGLLWCLICRNMATALAWREWPSCSRPSRVDRATAAAHLGGRHRVERQGFDRGVLRRHRPRLRPANGIVHLAASVSFQRAGSGRWRPIGDADLARLRQRIEAAIAQDLGAARRTIRRFRSPVRAGLPAFPGDAQCDFAVFEAGIGGRYDAMRLIGALVTCVTSVDYEHVELLGHSLQLIASDKSDACAAGGTIVYGENCRSLRPHLIEYNRHRDGHAAVRPRADRHRRRSRLGVGAAVRLPVRTIMISADRNRAARRVSAQQRRHCHHPVPALAATRAPPQGSRADRSRRARRPARDALARPPRDHPARPAHRDRRRPHPRRRQAIARRASGRSMARRAGSS